MFGDVCFFFTVLRHSSWICDQSATAIGCKLIRGNWGKRATSSARQTDSSNRSAGWAALSNVPLHCNSIHELHAYGPVAVPELDPESAPAACKRLAASQPIIRNAGGTGYKAFLHVLCRQKAD